MNPRRLVTTGLALALAVGITVVALAMVKPGRSAGPLLNPDLRMARLADFGIANSNGQLQLRFSATIVNVGQGPFELSATRADSGSPFGIFQKLYDGTGASTTTSVPGATLVWGGDGHSHWHVRNLESYELDRLDNGSKVGTGMKSGFCFFDTTPFNLSIAGAPAGAVYVPGTVCGAGDQGALNVKLGISVGWGDRYGATLRDQYIDVTNLTSGNYRLVATADAANNFTELSDSNNTTWADLKLTLNRKGKGSPKVTVITYGPVP